MSNDPAKARFFALNLGRLFGVFAVLIGILITQGAVAAPSELGWVLLALGLVATFVLPQVLARRWRSPKQ